MKQKYSELEVYKTTSVLALVLLVIFIWKDEFIFLILATILLLNNLIFFRANEVVTEYWMAFSRVVERVMSKIILGFIFYVFLTPIAFLYRIFNRTQVEKFKINNKESYFEDVPKIFEKNDFNKQW